MKNNNNYEIIINKMIIIIVIVSIRKKYIFIKEYPKYYIKKIEIFWKKYYWNEIYKI